MSTSLPSGVAAVFIFLLTSARPVFSEPTYFYVDEQSALPARDPAVHIDQPVARSYSFASNLFWSRDADGQLHQELHESSAETVRNGMQQLKRSSRKDCIDANCNEFASSSTASVGSYPQPLAWRQPVFVGQPVMLRGSMSKGSRGVQFQPATIAGGVPDVDFLTIEETQGMQGLGSIAKLFANVLEDLMEAVAPQPELAGLGHGGPGQEELVVVDGVAPQLQVRTGDKSVEQESSFEDKMEDSDEVDEQQEQVEEEEEEEPAEEEPEMVEVEAEIESPTSKLPALAETAEAPTFEDDDEEEPEPETEPLTTKPAYREAFTAPPRPAYAPTSLPRAYLSFGEAPQPATIDWVPTKKITEAPRRPASSEAPTSAATVPAATVPAATVPAATAPAATVPAAATNTVAWTNLATETATPPHWRRGTVPPPEPEEDDSYWQDNQ